MLDAHPPTFTPLASPRSFRLLKLLALRVPVIQEQRYGLTLCNFHLDNCPEYLALSYTWRKALYLSIECTEDEDPQMSTEEPCQVLLGHVPAGEDYTTGPTNITGSLFTITENLLDALVQLASSGYADKWLWIDALCIDQSNSDEKGIQVAMMGEIYSKASQVIVWLGSDTSNLEDFLWLNTEFLAGIGHYIQEFGVEDLMKQTPFSYKLLEFMKLQPPSGDWVICWENYMSFCRRRRWFSRIWIVQEVALAQEVVVLCGESTIPWYNVDTLSRLLRVLGWQSMVGPNASKAFGRAIGDESVRISVIIDRLKATVDRGTADGQLLEPPSSTTVADNEASISAVHAEEIFYDYFQTLLLDARPYSATEARDKIFEVFGIAQKALPPGMAMPLKPNYTSESTTQSLFTSVAALLLEKLPRLSNLSHVEDKCSRRVPNLPSWVPDYTNRLTPIPLTFIRGLNFAFDCCPDNILPEEKHTIERGLLELTGAFFDRVAKVCLPLWEVIKSSDIEPCMKLCLKIREPYLDLKQDAGEVLWRTMIADTHNSQPAAETMGPVFSIWARNRIAIKLTPEIRVIDETGAITSNVRLDEALLRSQLSTLRGLHDASAGKLSLPTVDEVLMSIKQLHRFKLQDFVSQNAILYPNDPFPTGAEQINRLEKDAAAFHFALGPTMPFRRLYLTKKGYLGLGPESMEVDDQVFMLQAARVPFVLREKADSSFELMGETYIHGFMEGRMVAELKVEMGPVHIS